MGGFLFNLEGALTEGNYFLPGTVSSQKVIHRANAFALEGGWKTHIPRLEEALGLVDLSFLYAQGSGDKPSTNQDEAFFAPQALRFDGAGRMGRGELLGATAFDALSSSNTWNGLPHGLSGVSTFGFGFKTSECRQY